VKAGHHEQGDPKSIVFTGDQGEILTGEIVDAKDAILPESPDPSLQVPAIAIDRILQAVPELAKAVRGGKIMRVIGGPSGPLWEVDGGVLATVRGEKGIVGHLRFDGPPKDVRVVAAPAAAFQLASAVTLQYYLDTITNQLESLQFGIADVKEWLSAEARAELDAAEQNCADIARHLTAGATLRVDDRVKLNSAHDVARRRFAAARGRLDSLAALTKEAVTDTGEIRNRAKLKRALSKGGTDGVRDYQDILHAALLTVRALALLATSEATSEPARLETTTEAAIREIEQLRVDLFRLSSTLSTLDIRKSAIEREFTWAPHKWGKEPYEALNQYRARTKDLRRILRRPGESLLPKLVADKPWIIEARAGADGAFETRASQLELSGPAEATLG
jgi:hypothetical protein